MEFGYFWGWTVIGVKVGIYYEIGPQSPSLDSQGDRKATHGNVNWIFQVENRGSSLPQELFNKYVIKASHSRSQPLTRDSQQICYKRSSGAQPQDTLGPVLTLGIHMCSPMFAMQPKGG